MTITAAADGSSLGNPGPTGWAWYIDDDQWAAGGFDHGTNNIGELTAVAELLDATAHVADEPLHVLCDSKYVIDSCTKWMRGWKYNGWKKKDGKPVLNVELMRRLDAAMQGRRVTFQWVKGHAGHPENEAADERARDAATAYSRGREPITGPGFGGGAGPDASARAGDARDDAPGGAARRGGGGGGGDSVRDGDDSVDDRAGDRADDAAVLDVRGDGVVPLWDEEPGDEPGAATDDAIVAGLERERIEAVARRSIGRLDELLHDEFEVVDPSGTRIRRDALLEALSAAPPERGSDVAVVSLRSRPIANGVRLVQFDTERDGATTRCASTWVFAVDGPDEGHWQLRYHQATHVE